MVPKISIIVPIYKAEKFINKSVNSILNQTLKNIEVILIDDGSPDLSGKIAENFALKDQRVRVIHCENRGPSFARNIGIHVAKGDYIGFVDSDDWIEERMYEVLYDQAVLTGSEIVMCGITIEDRKQQSPNLLYVPLKEGVQHKEALVQNIILPMVGPENHHIFSTPTHMLGSACRNIFKRSFIQENSIVFPTDMSYAEDLLFCFDCYIMCNTLCVVNKPFYHYLYHNTTSLTRGYRGDLFEGLLQVHEYLDKKVKDHGLLDSCQMRLDARLLNAYLKSILNTCKKENKVPLPRKIGQIYQILSYKRNKSVYKRLDVKQLNWKHRLLVTLIKYKLAILLYLYSTTRRHLKFRRLQ